MEERRINNISYISKVSTVSYRLSLRLSHVEKRVRFAVRCMFDILFLPWYGDVKAPSLGSGRAGPRHLASHAAMLNWGWLGRALAVVRRFLNAQGGIRRS